MSDHRLYRVISCDVEDGEPEGVIWVQTGGGNKDRVPALPLGRVVKSYVDELANGESVTMTFYRHDMTRDAIKAIPEI